MYIYIYIYISVSSCLAAWLPGCPAARPPGSGGAWRDATRRDATWGDARRRGASAARRERGANFGAAPRDAV